MIAEWMLYAALCALALFAAGAVIERGLLNAGAQVRHVWTAALLLSLAIPVVAYRFAPRRTIAIPASVSAPTADIDPSIAITTPAVTATPSAEVAAPHQSLRKLIPTDRLAGGVWIALSAALFAYFLAGLIAIARMRRQWRPSDVCGVKVLVSEETGPAVVNAFAPQIVMPAWALAMDRYQLGLMIRHEQEHRRAGDPQLLAFAQLALVAMPWNPALWWGIQRLGMAIELDCDARVLRTADPRTYGDLLLEVARPRRHPRLVPIAAFAERAGGLERRIRAIARRRGRATRGARAGAAIIGLAVVGIAWAAPHPSVPPQWSIVPPTSVALARTDTALTSPLSLENTKQAAQPTVPPETLATRKPSLVIRGDTVVRPTTKAVRGDAAVATQPPRPSFSGPDSLIYDRLFAGIVLPPDQELAARVLLSSLAQLQVEQDRQLLVNGVQGAVARLRINQERDSMLAELLPSDNERDLVASRLAALQIGGGRRGRSANPPGLTEIAVEVPVGGGRVGGRGRVGGGAPGGEVPVAVAIDDMIFNRVFDGISLSAEQQTSARSILSTYRQKLAATIPEPAPVQLRLQGTTGVVMRPDSRVALLAILSSDADRALVDSRILTEVRVVNRQPTPPTR